MRRWTNELVLGARLAISGGREGRLRTALAAIGVGLGVALLLICASLPNMLAQHQHRGDARDYVAFGGPELPASDGTMLVARADTVYHNTPITGLVLQPDGVRAPVPPGLPALPHPGELYVSPALADLMSTPDGALLRERFPGHIVGPIADPGLSGPNELVFYLGSDTLIANQNSAVRIDHFGDFTTGEGLDPVLTLLVVVIFVVLLLPIGIFVAAAVRFGGDRRDRRLAAVRLVGADTAMARRIASGEALLSALFGLVAGAVFFLVVRQFVERLTLQRLSAFSHDVQPSPVLAVLIVAAVPVAAVGLTLLSLRRVVIEPLGVVRQAREARRKLWWRLAIPIVGLLLLYPLLGDIQSSGTSFNEYEVGAGLTLVLLGAASLLPWLVQAVVRRLGRGGVSWQLAVRRLQLDSTTSARAVSGIAVAAAGAIALQMLFGVAQVNYQRSTGQDPTRAQVNTTTYAPRGEDTVTDRLRRTPGVTAVTTYQTSFGTFPPPAGQDEGNTARLIVGSCADLAQLATATNCADGDVFIFGPRPDDPNAVTPQPGQTIVLGEGNDPGLPQWTIPAGTPTVAVRPDPTGGYTDGLYLTPAAAGTVLAGTPAMAYTQSYLTIDSTQPEVLERIRNTAAGIDPTMQVEVLSRNASDPHFADIRRGLLIGATATLALIGASLLVSMVEQLRERRRLLAMLVAFGTRRTTLSLSLLWQALMPMALGIVLAAAAGTGLGALLMRMVGEPVRIDWASIGGVSAAAAGVVLLVTGLSLPALWRLMRPEGLRTE